MVCRPVAAGARILCAGVAVLEVAWLASLVWLVRQG
jgi:hypothetical protein